MANTKSKTTTPNDFLNLESYIDKDGNTVEGNFPIYISTISECCLENGNLEVIPLVIPKP